MMTLFFVFFVRTIYPGFCPSPHLSSKPNPPLFFNTYSNSLVPSTLVFQEKARGSIIGGGEGEGEGLQRIYHTSPPYIIHHTNLHLSMSMTGFQSPPWGLKLWNWRYSIVE